MNKGQETAREKLIDFKKVGAIMQKNFVVLIRDRTRTIPLLLFPVLMILIFGYTTGNIPKHISTAVVAYENSPLSQQIQQEIANNQVFSIRYVVSTEGEGKKLLDSGKVRAIIEIPPNLQDDLEKGKQPGITLIVDESDSAVAATARQTLYAIVDNIAAGISAQKTAGFQLSVGAATQQLLAYNSQQANLYGVIASRTAPAESALKQAKELSDADAKHLVDSLTPPTLLYPTTSGQEMVNSSNTYVSVPPGNAGIEAQIAILQRTSRLISIAADNVHAATSIAEQADTKAKTLQDSQVYDNNVGKPVSAIQVFTQYKTNSLLQPIVYEEKPAYGTGKRPIDFLIASIIALTIFQGAVMGMGRAVAGEKREGSLTRVFLTPTSTATIIAGTLLFYIIFELFRSAFIILVSMLFFKINIQGSLFAIGLILVIYAGVSTGIGMILSSAVKTEQQFMAMSMLISMPTIFLAGVFFPLQAMPKALQILGAFLPVTYAGEALRGVMIKGFSVGMIAYPLLILFAFLVGIVGLVFMVFKRDIE